MFLKLNPGKEDWILCQSLEILYYYLANYLGKFLIKSNVYFLGDCKSILV